MSAVDVRNIAAVAVTHAEIADAIAAAAGHEVTFVDAPVGARNCGHSP